jgi:hypothetical protein
MYLVATFRIPLTDVGVDAGYITGYDINIRVAGSQEDFEKAGLCVPGETNDQDDLVANAGKAIVDRLHINLVDESGDSLYDACDADSSEWEAVFAGFLCEDGDRGFYKEIPETTDCCQRDVLLIHDISLNSEYQSRGLEMAVAARIIETLGSWCDLVIYNYGDHMKELEALKPMGFLPGPVEGHAFINLNYSHSVVHRDGFCKFVALPVDLPESKIPAREDGKAWFWCLHCERIWLGTPGSRDQCPRAKRGECDASPFDTWQVGEGNDLPALHWPPVEQWQEGQLLTAFTTGEPHASA